MRNFCGLLRKAELYVQFDSWKEVRVASVNFWFAISLIKIQIGGNCNRQCQFNEKLKECKDKEFCKTDTISLETKSIWLLLISRCSYLVYLIIILTEEIILRVTLNKIEKKNLEIMNHNLANEIHMAIINFMVSLFDLSDYNPYA